MMINQVSEFDLFALVLLNCVDKLEYSQKTFFLDCQVLHSFWVDSILQFESQAINDIFLVGLVDNLEPNLVKDVHEQEVNYEFFVRANFFAEVTVCDHYFFKCLLDHGIHSYLFV